ncbi:RagB/SusD family nutrient uptake outer membrane protein [Echinicola strongylocentroti]|uniref:RagB/SusD family nutrient uptake outer membrane protein n=1 Tax=Echinicola strongylocentroti TaxID=1795355 RepID=A0A2Z4IL04_9BACT|nr:RagB/SusD family nutrient uptake outer membrane protein [Echinicola strongylocentroti]AWW31574.1 RagB/SusD family nutrient uptake outer membrane protein [Echinicola strongylocentroti]
MQIKNIINKLSVGLLLSGALSMGACDYLDIVPDDVSTVEDAFKRPNEAMNFLYSLYGFMPAENDMFSAIALWGTDELVTPWDRSHYYAKRMMRGELNATDPFFDYWTPSGDIDMYDGIRQCYIFLDNIDGTPGFSEAEVTRMKGEATFLIAYYHFNLLRQYGPIVLMRGEVAFDAPEEEYFAAREPYDECVSFIAGKFDEAISLLPSSVASASELGRVTKVIAQSIKSRMYLYAASPLFNGNAEFYQDFTNKDGTPLMNTGYAEEKWLLALEETKKAIDQAEALGKQLYEHELVDGAPSEQGKLNYRYSMVQPWNEEVVWGYSRPEPYYGWQRHSMPRVAGAAYNGQAPSISMVERYYTKNGLPIDVDPEFDYTDRYDLADSTILLHRDREPRFYASIAYDRGVFLANSTEVVMHMREGEEHGWSSGQNNYSPTGYLVQKGVHPESIITTSQNQVINYPWPLVRLGELYLSYAEALNEYYGAARHTEVIEYLDEIRQRAGVPTIQEAWSRVGKTSFSKQEMREIIKQERNIELAFEGHRTWDVRRWKEGDENFNTVARGLEITANAPEDFYKVVNAENRIFNTPSYYLFPIRISELEINQNLVQNPGW